MKANIELNPPNQISKFYFDAQLIRDNGVDLQLTLPATSSSSRKDTSLMRKCFNCRKMRVHVSAHIVRGDISGHDLCGFCGKEGCNNEVAVTQKSSQKF